MPKLDEEYVARMEEVLDVLNQAADERAPVVALDERPVQLLDSLRPGTPMAPAKVARRDYEYARCGTANIFCIIAPEGGRHHTHATPNRTAPRFAAALETDCQELSGSRNHSFGDGQPQHPLREVARRPLWHRARPPAVGALHRSLHAQTRQLAQSCRTRGERECLGHNRVASFAELRRRTRVWNARANGGRRRIDWRFTSVDARRVFRYK